MDKEKRKHVIPMPKQKVEERIHNFNEVALGYNKEQAVTEAGRCIQCPQPQCIEGCPVEIDIPTFIKYIKEKKYYNALYLASQFKLKDKILYAALLEYNQNIKEKEYKTALKLAPNNPFIKKNYQRFKKNKKMKREKEK